MHRAGTGPALSFLVLSMLFVGGCGGDGGASQDQIDRERRDAARQARQEERPGGGNGYSASEKRVEANEKRAKAAPKAEAPRKALVRDLYQLAVAGAGQDGRFTGDARKNLAASAANWEAYLALEPDKPDSSLARVALRIYDPAALNKPKEAQKAAGLIAEAENDTNAYLNLVQYAVLAGDTRTADLAGQKAVALAPKGERKAVKNLVKQVQTAAGAQGAPAAPAAP